jgi:hypothetical protein
MNIYLFDVHTVSLYQRLYSVECRDDEGRMNWENVANVLGPV